MSEAWLNFGVVVFAQFILFIVHAYYANKLSDVPRTLGMGALIGVVVGLFYDLILGMYFGLASYTLGFTASFLSINWVLSYGIFAANTLLMQDARLRDFFLWTIVVVTIYETVNHFFLVWTWKFEHLLAFSSSIEFLTVLLVGYCSGALFVATLAHTFLGYRFLVIKKLFNPKDS